MLRSMGELSLTPTTLRLFFWRMWLWERKLIMLVKDAVVEIMEEFKKATQQFGEFASPHEGYAVILEELDELWDAIKNKKYGIAEMKKEVTQVGAMAMRFLVDCIPDKEKEEG